MEVNTTKQYPLPGKSEWDEHLRFLWKGKWAILEEPASPYPYLTEEKPDKEIITEEPMTLLPHESRRIGVRSKYGRGSKMGSRRILVDMLI